ncbi:MAG: hypothetical protein ACNS61_14310 [Candidatus Wenzhouxiangella sp. M2_3B_020]
MTQAGPRFFFALFVPSAVSAFDLPASASSQAGIITAQARDPGPRTGSSIPYLLFTIHSCREPAEISRHHPYLVSNDPPD